MALYIAGLSQFRPSEAEAALASAARRNSRDWHGRGPRPLDQVYLGRAFHAGDAVTPKLPSKYKKSGLRRFKLSGVKIKVDATSKPEVAELPCLLSLCTS